MIKHMKIDEASYNCSGNLPLLVLMETHFSSGIKKVTGFYIYVHEEVKEKCPSAIGCLCLSLCREFSLSFDIQSF